MRRVKNQKSEGHRSRDGRSFARNQIPGNDKYPKHSHFRPHRLSAVRAFLLALSAFPFLCAVVALQLALYPPLLPRSLGSGGPLRRLNQRAASAPIDIAVQETFLRGIRREQGEDKMKTGKTLPELEAELKRQCGMKRDFFAPTRLLNVRSNGHTDLAWQGSERPYPLNANAHSSDRAVRGHPAGLL